MCSSLRPASRLGVWSGPQLASAKKLADFMLPPLRLACRTPVQAHDSICAECWNDIEFIEPPRYDRLDIELPYHSHERIISAVVLSDPAIYDRARAVARYDGVMRELIHGFKSCDHHEAVRLFSRWLLHAGADILEDTELLVPVPLARVRLWSGRFNQSATLAANSSRLQGIPHDPFALLRIRSTASQVGLRANAQTCRRYTCQCSRAGARGRSVDDTPLAQYRLLQLALGGT